MKLTFNLGLPTEITLETNPSPGGVQVSITQGTAEADRFNLTRAQAHAVGAGLKAALASKTAALSVNQLAWLRCVSVAATGGPAALDPNERPEEVKRLFRRAEIRSAESAGLSVQEWARIRAQELRQAALGLTRLAEYADEMERGG